MFKTILLAIDGSENARRAAESACGLVREIAGSSLVVVYASPNPPSQSRIMKADFDVHTLLIEDAHAVAGQTLDYIKNSGTAYTLEVSMGAPALEIIKIAEKTKAGLIVMGSRGLGSLKGAVLGSVSQRVAQHAACPVMIVK